MLLAGPPAQMIYALWLGAVDGCNVFGNTFMYYGVGIQLSGAAARNWVGANSYNGLGTKVNDLGTNNVIAVTQ